MITVGGPCGPHPEPTAPGLAVPEMRRIAPLGLIPPFPEAVDRPLAEFPEVEPMPSDGFVSKKLGGMAGCWKGVLVLLFDDEVEVVEVVPDEDTVDGIAELADAAAAADDAADEDAGNELADANIDVGGEDNDGGDRVDVSLLGTLLGGPPATGSGLPVIAPGPEEFSEVVSRLLGGGAVVEVLLFPC